MDFPFTGGSAKPSFPPNRASRPTMCAWEADALLPRLAELAGRRQLSDLTTGPVLSWNNEQIKTHIDAVLAVNGAELLFGGKQTGAGGLLGGLCADAERETGLLCTDRQWRWRT